MNIITAVTDFLAFLISHRRSGTTTLIEKIAEEHDCHVLVPYMSEKRKPYHVSLMELKAMAGEKPKPILVDNHTLLVICEEVLREHHTLANIIKANDRAVRQIESALQVMKDVRATHTIL